MRMSRKEKPSFQQAGDLGDGPSLIHNAGQDIAMGRNAYDVGKRRKIDGLVRICKLLFHGLYSGQTGFYLSGVELLRCNSSA